MYNYDLNKGEILKKEIVNIAVDINKKRYLVNIFVTTDKLIFFYNISLNSPLRTRFNIPPQYEILISVPIKNIDIKKSTINEDTYIEYKSNKITVYDINLLFFIEH